MKQSPVSAWTIIAFLMGTLFGSGGVWEYQRIKLDSQKLEIERAVQTTDLREKENEELAKIVELSNEYVSVASQYEKAPNAELSSQLTNKIDQLRARLAGMKDNFKALENKLAAVEGRQPRDIRLEFIAPASPTLCPGVPVRPIFTCPASREGELSISESRAITATLILPETTMIQMA